MSAVARAAIAGCGLLALAACSGGTRETAPPITVTTTVTASSTTAAPSTTGAPTTTLSPQQQDEAEIRALHDRFFEMLVVTADPPNPDHPEIAATTTGIQQQRWTEQLLQRREFGEHYDGLLHGTPQRLTFDDTRHVSLLTCTTDATLLRAPSGVVERADGPPFLTELRITRTSDGWRVEDWFTGGGEPCDG